MNRTYYVVNFTPGPNWEADKPMSKQHLGEHRAYYQSLIEAGKVLIGGGFIASSEGMSILIASDAEQAEAICKNDPAIKSGVFSYKLRTLFAVFRGLNDQQLDLSNL